MCCVCVAFAVPAPAAHDRAGDALGHRLRGKPGRRARCAYGPPARPRRCLASHPSRNTSNSVAVKSGECRPGELYGDQRQSSRISAAIASRARISVGDPPRGVRARAIAPGIVRRKKRGRNRARFRCAPEVQLQRKVCASIIACPGLIRSRDKRDELAAYQNDRRSPADCNTGGKKIGAAPRQSHIARINNPRVMQYRTNRSENK